RRSGTDDDPVVTRESPRRRVRTAPDPAGDGTRAPGDDRRLHVDRRRYAPPNPVARPRLHRIARARRGARTNPGDGAVHRYRRIDREAGQDWRGRTWPSAITRWSEASFRAIAALSRTPPATASTPRST